MLQFTTLFLKILLFAILGLSNAEKAMKASVEKDKGNEAFKAGDFKEALIYYNRSISLQQSAAVYNNRAITYIKMERFEDAILDCETVLMTEPNNVKGNHIISINFHFCWFSICSFSNCLIPYVTFPLSITKSR